MEIEFIRCDLEIKDIIVGKGENSISFSQINDILVELTISIVDILNKALENLTRNYDKFIKQYNENLLYLHSIQRSMSKKKCK